jgi:hypothetical protein
VLVRWLVERRVHDLGRLDRPLPVRDLLGPLVDQQDDHVGLGVRVQDPARDVLEDGRLPGLGRRDHHPTLALSHRGDHVDDPAGHVGGTGLQPEPVVREQRGQLLEGLSLLGGLGIHAVHRFDLEQREVLLVVLRLPHLAGDRVPLTEHEPAHLRERDVDVLRAGQVPGGAQEAVALGQHVEESGGGGGVGDLLLPQLQLSLAPFLALATPLLA